MKRANVLIPDALDEAVSKAIKASPYVNNRSELVRMLLKNWLEEKHPEAKPEVEAVG